MAAVTMEASLARMRMVGVAVALVSGGIVAAETPSVTIELVHDSPGEQRAKVQLERLLKEYDLSRWLFTKKVRIEQFVRPHSHPVLTLNTRSVDSDRRTIANFVHEEIHWFLTGRSGDFAKAMADVRKMYPDAPEGLTDGGAGSRQSTTLHLIVCQLEFESTRELLGAEQAVAIVKEQITEGQSGLGYHWIYQKVLDDQARLSPLIRQHKLTLPGIP
jgi:hypothetical protein